jgi:hypothetical protein
MRLDRGIRYIRGSKTIVFGEVTCQVFDRNYLVGREIHLLKELHWDDLTGHKNGPQPELPRGNSRKSSKRGAVTRQPIAAPKVSSKSIFRFLITAKILEPLDHFPSRKRSKQPLTLNGINGVALPRQNVEVA